MVLPLMLAGMAAHASTPNASVPPPALLKSLLAKFKDSRQVLGNHRYTALLNYRQPSWEPRFYVIDPESSAVVGRYVVAHGRGSDPDHDGYADRFGDRPESHMSSLGFFRTDETYVSDSGGHGLSMRLVGLSGSNRNAWDRAIVIHANWYMEPGFLAQRRKPGRSYGCLVFSDRDRNEIVDKLKGGALLYAAY
jgi:hypothetical protein